MVKPLVASQKPANAESVTMFRINYLPPEQTDGSRMLGLMVAWYLVAMLGGILLLGYLTAPAPNTIIATTAVTLKK